MFSGLANFITKHYKLVIVLWIIVLFYTFPLVFKINDVVVYTESGKGLENLESVKADEIISENFAGSVANSTIMIVIQNTDVLTPEVRDFSSALYHDVVTDGGLGGIGSVNYLYSATEGYLTQVIYQMAPALQMMIQQTNQTAQMVFGVPLFIAQTHMYILSSSGGSLDDAAVTTMVMAQLSSSLQASGLNAENVSLALGYGNAFYTIWLPTHTLDPDTLLSQIQTASAAFFGPLGELGVFAVSISQAFTVLTFNSTLAVTQFSIGALSTVSGIDPALLADVVPMGPSPSLTEANALAQSLIYNPTSSFDDIPGVPSYLVSQFVNTRPASGQANNTMLMVVSLTVGGSSDTAAKDVRVLRTIVSQHLSGMGSEYSVYVSGDPALNVDMMDAVEEDVSRIDPVTIILVVFLVGMFFRSAVTPWIPLMTIGMAYLTSTAIIYIMGTYFLSIHYSVMTIVLTVMLGAGTDYCIFIMSRYREERVMGKPKEEAVRTSLTWAGESIATSGATVMIGFGALMIGSYSMVRSMGMALVVAVGMALLFALTMLPSLLMLVGDRVFWPRTIEQEIQRYKKRDVAGGGYFRKSAKFSLKHRKAIILAALLISVPAIYLFTTLESSYDFLAGLPSAESKKGLDALGAGFGQGTILPTYIVVQFPDIIVENGSLTPAAAVQLESYSLMIDNIDNVRSVSGPTRPFGTPVNDTYLSSLPQSEKATYEAVIAGAIGKDNRTVLLTVVLQDSPFTLTSIHTIDHLREANRAQQDLPAGSSELVGGSTAGMADVSISVSKDFFTMRIAVIIGIFIVLMLVLGSLLIPVRLILTVLLNVTWTIAMTMIIFQVLSGIPVLWMVPLILFVIAMGLGMDYDIFLTTRIREEVSKGKTDEQAILLAVERTGGIITACGLVMAGAFGSMMLSSTSLLREFGFALFFAILLDAMVIRIYLVPAIMLMLQKWNWYAPGRLQRVGRREKLRKD